MNLGVMDRALVLYILRSQRKIVNDICKFWHSFQFCYIFSTFVYCIIFQNTRRPTRVSTGIYILFIENKKKQFDKTKDYTIVCNSLAIKSIRDNCKQKYIFITVIYMEFYCFIYLLLRTYHKINSSKLFPNINRKRQLLFVDSLVLDLTSKQS